MNTQDHLTESPESTVVTQNATPARYSKLLALAGILFAPVVLFGTIYLISVALSSLPSGVNIQISVMFSMLGFLVATVLYATLIGKMKTLASFLKLKNFHWQHITTGLFTAIMLYVIATMIAIVALAVGESTDTEAGANNTSSNLGSLDIGSFLLISVLFVALLTPIAEELFFRGAVLGSLVQDSKNKIVRFLSVAFVTVFFAMMHFQEPTGTVSDWTAVIVPGTVGLAAALLTLKYDSLYPAIFTHIFYNGTVAIIIGMGTFG